MDLLIFFALPLATIILAAILQTILKSPILVAAFSFAIYLIVAFAVFDETFLIAVFIYTLLALLTAIIVNKWDCITECEEDETQTLCSRLVELLQNTSNNSNSNTAVESLENLLDNGNSNNSSNCGCNRFRNRRFH